MLFSSAFSSALLVGIALAEGINMRQYMTAHSMAPSSVPFAPSGIAPAKAPESTGQVKMMVVKVGGADGSLTFEPNNLQAPVGSMIQFQFWPKNHSVVRSSFDKPCVPIEQSTPGSTGFFSGFMPVQQDLGIFTIKVADAKPIWFYCSQGKHCQSGMVGVINAPANNSSRTIDTFKDLAKQAPANISPAGNGSSSSSTNSPNLPSTILPGATPASSSSSSQLPAAATGSNAAGTVRIGGAIAIVALGMALLA